MKFRKDFVTNSSSSSFVCELCGRTESGWDMVLRDAEMVECVNGHTICVDEMLTPPRELMIQLIREEMESSWSNIEYLTDEELNEKTDEELEDLMLEREDVDTTVCRKSAVPFASLLSIPIVIWQDSWSGNIRYPVTKFLQR